MESRKPVVARLKEEVERLNNEIKFRDKVIKELKMRVYKTSRNVIYISYCKLELAWELESFIRLRRLFFSR